MGLFSRFRVVSVGQAPTMHEQAQAVIAPAVVVMLANGHMQVEELEQLANLCAFSPLFRRLESACTQQMIEAVIEDLRHRSGAEVVAGSARVLAPGLRETALCYAIRVALADGILDEHEREAIIDIAQRLAVPPEVFHKIFDVMAMMQRPAVS